MNKKIFDTLIDLAAENGVNIQDADKARWLKTDGAIDRALMTEASIGDKLVITKRRRGAFIRHEEQKFLLATGFPECVSPPMGMTPIQLTTGMFAVGIDALNLSPTCSGAQVRDALELEYKDCPGGYDGHELAQISQLFPSIQAFELDESYEIIKDITRSIGGLICSSEEDWPIPLNNNTLTTVSEIFESGSDHIPYHNALQGLVAISWPTLYLELYRCIEHLYFVPRVTKLKLSLGLTGDIQAISKQLEKSLSWRPKEQEALKALISQCQEDTVKNTITSFSEKADISKDRDKLDQNASELIYDLRNDIVHFRPINEIVNKAPEEWNSIISAMAKLLIHLYERFEVELSLAEKPEAKPAQTEAAAAVACAEG